LTDWFSGLFNNRLTHRINHGLNSSLSYRLLPDSLIQWPSFNIWCRNLNPFIVHEREGHKMHWYGFENMCMSHF